VEAIQARDLRVAWLVADLAVLMAGGWSLTGTA
jgi:hypothetical protein